MWRGEERSVLSNEAYWHSFCLTDLPVLMMNWLRPRKGNGTIACRERDLKPDAAVRWLTYRQGAHGEGLIA